MKSHLSETLFLPVVLLILLSTQAFCDYTYDDNVKDYMASGVRSFDSGKLLDAQIDFENILSIDPKNKGAILKLLDVLILRKERGSAKEILVRVQKEKLATPDEIATYTKKINSLKDKEPVRLVKSIPSDEPFVLPLVSSNKNGDSSDSSGNNSSGKDGATAALLGLNAFDKPVPPKSSGKDGATAALLGLDAFDKPALEMDKKSGNGDGSDKSVKSDVGIKSGSEPIRGATKPQAKMTPADQFKLAMSLKKNGAQSLDSGSKKEKTDLLKAIRLFVSSVMADPSLLAESDDGGLLNISKEHYERLAKKEPKNPKYHFLTAYFHDICSEHALAMQSYEKVASLAADGSRLQAVARSKMLSVERVMNADKLSRAAASLADDSKKQDDFFANVAKGHHDKFTTAVEYAAEAKNIYGQWTKNKDNALLDHATAYYRGAIHLDPKEPTFHYGLALVYIEKAATGDIKSKDDAKKALEATLANSPSDTMKESAEKLLASVSK